MTRTLKALTLNTWMLRTPIGLDIAEDVDERLRLLPEKCAATGADLIFFQENWDPVVRSTLKRDLHRLGYPYEASRRDVPADSRWLGMTSITAATAPLILAAQDKNRRPSRRDFLKHGALLFGTIGLNAAGAGSMAFDSFRRSMGNGLQIFSKYPLSEPKQLSFSVHTRSDEALVVKGAIHTTARVPELGPVDCYTTHLGAVTFEPKLRRDNDAQCAARLVQAKEFAAWIAKTRQTPYAIVAGDFNTHYRKFRDGTYTNELSGEYLLFAGGAPRGLGLWDTYRQLHGFQEPPAITDDIRNPYKVRGAFESSPDCVIDYVFASPTPRLVPVASEVVFSDPITDAECRRHRLRRRPERLSDHYGVLTTFHIV